MNMQADRKILFIKKSNITFSGSERKMANLYSSSLSLLLFKATVGEVRGVERRQFKRKTYFYCTDTYGNTQTLALAIIPRETNHLNPRLCDSADIVSHHPSHHQHMYVCLYLVLLR